MGYPNEFEAGSIARLDILPKDAFGNNVTSSSGDPSWNNFTLLALLANGSVASPPNITRVAWNEHGYIGVEFLVFDAGHFVLLVQGGNQTLSGSPLHFSVNPGGSFIITKLS